MSPALRAACLALTLAAVPLAGRAALVTISDFSSLAHWGVGGGPGGNVAGSSLTIVPDTPIGALAAQSGLMTYAYGNANSFNYIDFYNDSVSLDLRGMQLDFWVKGLALPPNTVAIQLYSTSTNGFLQYDLAPGDLVGQWRHLRLDLATLANYGTAPDLSRINLLRFRAIGDAGGAGQTGSLMVHQLAFGPVSMPMNLPEPGTLALGLMALAAAAGARGAHRARRGRPVSLPYGAGVAAGSPA